MRVLTLGEVEEEAPELAVLVHLHHDRHRVGRRRDPPSGVPARDA